MLDDVFMSYRDCVLHKHQLTEQELSEFIRAQQELARTEYQGFLKDKTTANIATIEATLDAGEAKLDATM
jgi:hypothetical protein